MYAEILTNGDTLKEKIKKIVSYFRKSRGTRKAWKRRHSKVFHQNPSYETPCERNIELEHKKLWAPFNPRFDLSSLRVSAHISGKVDAQIVPEEIFAVDIEPSLMSDPNIPFLSNKSFYNQRFPDGDFPADLFHRFDGQWYDRNFKALDSKEFLVRMNNISYPVVIKPNRSSNGGKGVYFAKNPDELNSYSRSMPDCIVQEKVEQHGFFKSFHPSSLNTIRVYLYRSVVDHQLHILSMDLTMGKSGAMVNNETAGGIYSGISDDGSMMGYAVDKFGTKYDIHPDSGESFDQTVPDINGLKEFSLRVGQKILPATIIGLDVFYDKEEKWRMLEINIESHSIRSAQYFGQPFFGKFTGEVIEYCRNNHWALR